MIKEKLLEIVASYQNNPAFKNADGFQLYHPVRYTDNDEAPDDIESMEHILWMLEEIKLLAKDDENHDKIMRWLGFIQGALWQLGVFSILDVRDHNRSKSTV